MSLQTRMKSTHKHNSFHNCTCSKFTSTGHLIKNYSCHKHNLHQSQAQVSSNLQLTPSIDKHKSTQIYNYNYNTHSIHKHKSIRIYNSLHRFTSTSHFRSTTTPTTLHSLDSQAQPKPTAKSARQARASDANMQLPPKES